MKFISQIKRVVKPLSIWAFISLFNVAFAARKYDIGKSDNSFIDTILGGLQVIVDAISGPGVMLIAIISAIVGFALWTFAPKSGGLMFLARAFVSCLSLFNLGLLTAWYQS